MKYNKIIISFIIILVITLSLVMFIINKNNKFNLFDSFRISSIMNKLNVNGIDKNLFKFAIGTLDPSFGSNGIVISSFKKDIKNNENDDSANAIAVQPDGKILVVGDSGYKHYDRLHIVLMRYNTNGTLDKTFGTDGIVIMDIFDESFDSAKAIVLQRDGKILVAGESNNDIVLLRFNTNGKLDTSFGTGGIVITDINESDQANAIALQSDGKILVAGESNESIVILRYDSNGSLDKSFGIDGIVKIDISKGKNKANAIAIQTDGKILVAGESNKDVALLRFNTNGKLDTSFGTDGIVIMDVFEQSYDTANAIAIQPDGGILVAGNSFSNSNSDIVVVRYNSNGKLDTSFSTHGIVITDISERDQANAIALQPNGKILVAGNTGQGSIYDDICNGYIVVLRYSTNGSLDGTFGTNGIIKTDIHKSCDPNEYINAIALQPDGKILLAGKLSSEMGFYGEIVVLRYNTDGTLDKSFGSNGIVKTHIINEIDTANAIAIQSDGKILVAGSSNFNTIVLRYNTNGTLDTSFGTNGIVITNISKNDYANTIAIQSDGKILVAGSSNFNTIVLRYNTNGTLDTSFGTNGIIKTDIHKSCDPNEYINAIALQPDGKILLAGKLSSEMGFYGEIVVLRYNTNGTLDKSFGSNGIVKTHIINDIDTANAIAIQSDGKILVAGYLRYSGYDNSDVVLLRYNTDGSLDKSFGTDGKVIKDIRKNDRANAIALQPDGKILVAGVSSNGEAYGYGYVDNIFVMRYNSNGSLDGKFGTGGIVETDIDTSGFNDNSANAIVLQSDGKILVAGRTNKNIVVIRYQ